MKDIDYNQDFDIEFRYQFCSFLGQLEEERYVQKIFVDIVKTDDSGKDVQIIGKARQPFPLQFEAESTLAKCSDFERQMEYDQMEKDENKARKSLINFYNKVGFISVKGYDDLMFLLPGFKNKKLDAIDLNESIYLP